MEGCASGWKERCGTSGRLAGGWRGRNTGLPEVMCLRPGSLELSPVEVTSGRRNSPEEAFQAVETGTPGLPSECPSTGNAGGDWRICRWTAGTGAGWAQGIDHGPELVAAVFPGPVSVGGQAWEWSPLPGRPHPGVRWPAPGPAWLRRIAGAVLSGT